MKPGYEVEYVNANMYLVKPTQFLVKPLSRKQLEAFIKKLDAIWEQL